MLAFGVGEALEGLENVRVVKESDEALIGRLVDLDPVPEVIRYLGSVPAKVQELANDWHVPLADDPMAMIGRLEMRFYFREQSISETVHRYGNVIELPEQVDD